MILYVSSQLGLDQIINPDEAKDHYRQVCKALVATISDLSSMMSVIKIRKYSDLKELEMMEEKEWAGVFNMVSTNSLFVTSFHFLAML